MDKHYEPKPGDVVDFHNSRGDTVDPDKWVVIATQETDPDHHRGPRTWVWIRKANDLAGGAGQVVPSHELTPISY